MDVQRRAAAAGFTQFGAGKGARGFTLIELLVVIAIIGLLAAVVLASVGSARQKGADAAVKGQLSSVRTQAELYASNSATGSYGASNALCTDTQSNKGLASILAELATLSAGTVATAGAANAYNTIGCDSAATSWVVEAPLSGSTSASPNMWCVDSSGASKAEQGAAKLLGPGATACP